MNTTKPSTRHILSTLFLILGVASVFALVRPAVFAQNTYEERASFRTINTAKIKNSEGIKNIDVGTFIENIWENTGIYQMIHTKTVAERAAEKAAAAASAAKQAHDPFAGAQVPA